MYYDKNYALAKPERRRVVLSNFKGYDETKLSRNLPCDYVDCVYNYKFKNSRLTTPYGISALEFDGEIIPSIPDGLGDCKLFIKQRHVRNCYRADPAYGEGVAKAAGIDLQEALASTR